MPMKTPCVLALFALLLSACSTTTAPTRFHSLLSPAPAAQEPAGAAIAVDLAPVRVPASVDQMQWVVRLPDDSLRILEREQWVSPLRDELRAAIMERFATRQGAIDARAAPGAPAPVRVQVDVQRFESIAGRQAWVDATWSLQAAAASGPLHAPLVCRSSVQEDATGGLEALAHAHRRVVQRLADVIGERLRAVARGEPATCP